MLVCVVNYLSSLYKHLCFELATEIDCISYAKNIKPAVFLKLNYLLNVIPEVTEGISLSCLNNIGFGVYLYKIGHVSL